MVGSAIGFYSLWIARRIGAPGAVQARMLMNLAIDGAVGLIPFAGDLFDFAFKAHSRNHALLARWLASPHRAHRSSLLWVIAGALIMLALLVGGGWVLLHAVQWFADLFRSA